MRGADLVEAREVGREGVAAGFGARPVAELVLVLLVVDVLFRPRSRDVLEELIARVDAEGRGCGRGDGRADAIGRTAAELQVLGEDVGGVDEQVRSDEVRGLVRERAEELLELRLRVAPREVRVALLEPGGSETLQRRGPRERLGEEDDVGILGGDRRDEPLPELQGLGVRVVDAEDANTLRDPVPHHAKDLGADAARGRCRS